MNINDVVGIIGVGMILAAYFFNLYNIIKKEGRLYFILNILGSLLAATASYLIHYWPFVILEGCWCVVSLISLLRYSTKQDNVRDS